MQKKKAMEDKKKMEAHGWSRFAERGTCGFCGEFHEQLYATFIDVCKKHSTRGVEAAADKKIYFALVAPKLNIDFATGQTGILRCQAPGCSKKSPIMHQVNIKMCAGCNKKVGKQDHYRNTARDHEVRIKRIEKNRIASRE